MSQAYKKGNLWTRKHNIPNRVAWIFIGVAAIIISLAVYRSDVSFVDFASPPKERKANKQRKLSAKIIEFDSSNEAQARRRELLQSLINQGVFQKVVWENGIPKIWVTPQFMLLDYDDKKLFVEVVYAFYAAKIRTFGDDVVDSVSLLSSITNNRVGSYSMLGGLKIK